MIRLVATIAIFVTTTSAFADLMTVELVKKENTVEVKIGNRDFTTLHFDKSQAKPYFSPVLAADGAVISRPLENPEDHPHHKGIWCSIDEVNDIKFWAEKGKIENQSVELAPATGIPAKIKLVNHWLDAAGKPLLVETTTVSIYVNRLIGYDIQFAAADKPVTFGDTKEDLFGDSAWPIPSAAKLGERSSTPKGGTVKRNAGARNQNGSTTSARSTARRTA